MARIKQLFIPILLVLVMTLSGCLIQGEKDEGDKIGTAIKQEERVNPTVQVAEDYYAGLAPLKDSPTRNLMAETLAGNRLDRDRFELGLMELAQNYFSPEEHLFVGGQLISEEEGRQWLAKSSQETPEGLNPPDAPSTVLKQILEHNYYAANGQELKGVVIGLALASTYTETRENNTEQTLYYTADQLRTYGYDMAEKIVERLRAKGAEVPVVVALYQLEEVDAYRPGNFLSVGLAEAGQNISGWETINEVYMLFPSQALERLNSQLAKDFNAMVQNVGDFFPRYVGLVGTGRFVDEQLTELELRVTTEFASVAEVIQLTQYVGSEAMETFPEQTYLAIYLSSVNEPRAVFVRSPGQEPMMHFYR
jgi:protein involved in sex pheromone biosynthesis